MLARGKEELEVKRFVSAITQHPPYPHKEYVEGAETTIARAKKEKKAGEIATLIVKIFAAVLGFVLFLPILVLAVTAIACDAEMDFATQVVVVVESAIDISAKVFAPLLAFILGHYYYRRSRSKPKRE